MAKKKASRVTKTPRSSRKAATPAAPGNPSTRSEPRPSEKKRPPYALRPQESWPVERTWTVQTDAGERTGVPTAALGEYRVCCLLGAAGLGKTFELCRLAAAEQRSGRDVCSARLATLAQTIDGLTEKLASLADAATDASAIYLDALDEVMVPVPQSGLVVSSWVTDTLAETLPFIRISCRSAVWPADVWTAFANAYGERACVVASLELLSEDDIRSIAVAHAVDADAFTKSVEDAGVQVLARQPLTLKMLLTVHAAQGTLPKNRERLFADGIHLLADERHERREHRTTAGVPHDELIEAAERLACYLLLSGRDTVDQSDAPADSSLGRRELAGLRDGGPPLDDRMLDAIRRSGLSDGDSSASFLFAHRQVAEYLAGRRLATLLPHQSRSLLCAGEEWRSGVAGPLRETAAFAAMLSPDLAAWVTETDPEVIGLSDVADNGLRHRATANLLDRFRRRELTDEQVSYRDTIELKGFRYPNSEADLRQVLRERQPGCQDVLECGIRLIESWELASMSDDLADLMLDPMAPLQAREAAGYALRRIGTPEGKRRILPLAADHPDDVDFNLKGLALHCNYPDGISVPGLLAAMTPSRRDHYHGAYEGFLTELERRGFDAPGHRREGLLWARQFVGIQHGSSTCSRIAKHIAKAAVDELDDAGIADALALLILDTAEAHAESPLRRHRPLGSHDEETETEEPILTARVDARRRLIDAICRNGAKEAKRWWGARETPGLLAEEDFPWLLEQAIAGRRPLPERENFANLARMLPWQSSAAYVDAWLSVRTVEPIASVLPYPIVTVLDSDEARRAKREYRDYRRFERKPRQKKLKPPPTERVEQALSLSETKDHRFFVHLCRELTLAEDSDFYECERFLPQTPGWATADETTRSRITEAAKRAIERETGAPVECRSASFTSVLIGYMSAIWLLQERDPAWLEARPDAWWERWAWYILRELHPGLSGEAAEPKEAVLRTLHQRAGRTVRTELVDLVLSTVPESRSLLSGLLQLFESLNDAELDATLARLLEQRKVSADRVGDVAAFVLVRSAGGALAACEASLTDAALAESSERAVEAAVAMLQHHLVESWRTVHDLLVRRPDLATTVLGRFAHGAGRLRGGNRKNSSSLAGMSAPQLVELVSLLIEHFPPENDWRDGGARLYGDDDAGRDLRNQLLNSLGDRRDMVAVTALRTLEMHFGAKYDWLRRPRARAERAYRLTTWAPVSTEVVAELLSAKEKRLIRSVADAMDGIMAAIERYEERLRHGRPDDLEDFWNRQREGLPLPKEEERVSDKICDAIRDYFADYAVVADREVQLFRRKLPKAVGGAPGSLVDVLCTVPARGSVKEEPILVPIEVKRSHNPEARTGLRMQLVDRYVRERGANCGLFVVAWMGTTVPSGYKPLWPTRAAAQSELDTQAAEASREMLDVRSYVIDLSLPVTPRPEKSKKTARKAPAKKRTKTKSPAGSTVKKKAVKKPRRGGNKRSPKKEKNGDD